MGRDVQDPILCQAIGHEQFAVSVKVESAQYPPLRCDIEDRLRLRACEGKPRERGLQPPLRIMNPDITGIKYRVSDDGDSFDGITVFECKPALLGKHSSRRKKHNFVFLNERRARFWGR